MIKINTIDYIDYHLNLNKQSKDRNIYNCLLITYFILKPFYFFESGIPQISDFILVIMFFIIFASNKLYINKNSKFFLFSNLIFVCYVILINTFSAISTGGELVFLKYSSYYLFNLMVVVLIHHLYYKFGNHMIRIIFYGIASTIFIQIFILLYKGITGARETLYFNNPNQLGYFGLLCISLIITINYKLKVNKIIKNLALLGGLLLIFVSVSKACIVSALLLAIWYVVLSINRYNFIKIISIILIIFLVIYFAIFVLNMNFFSGLLIFRMVKSRLSNIGSSWDDNLSSRGYDRLLNHPEHLILGAGEGIFSRFESFYNGEIHSMFGNIIFSYGAIGLLLFVFILYSCISKKKIRIIYPIFFILLYNLTHNGIRQSLLWIFISLLDIFE